MNQDHDPTCDIDCLDTPQHEAAELIIDPSSGQLSMSRLCLGLMNVVGAVAGLYLAFTGSGQWAATIITAVVASDAGIYWRSTGKRFGNDCDKE